MTRVFRMNPLVSVIIPVYNVEQYLDKCVQSVINQTYKNIEVILVDDGSPDNCPKMCDEYSVCDKRIKVIHKSNGGLSDARNAGIDRAKGDYITFVDSDDYVEDNYVELLLHSVHKYNADISCGKQNVLYGDSIVKAYTGKHYVLNSEEALRMMLYHDDMDVSAWAKMYKRSLFEGIRFPVGRLYEDAATTYKLIDKADVITLESFPIYNYVMRNDSITNNSFSEKKLDLITSTREMTEIISKKYPTLDVACQRRLLYAYLSTLTQAVKSDNVNRDVVESLTNYINKNGHIVLRDNNSPLRDKIAVVATRFGYGFFRVCWNMYDKSRRKNGK